MNNLKIMNSMKAVMPKMQGVKSYNITTDEENDTAEITMYGEVVETVPTDWWTGEPAEGLFIVLSDFLNDIETLQSKKSITVRINSVGGNLEAGVAIYNRLKEMNDVTTIVDGLAASAASLILQAGKTRKTYKSSQVMVHEASTMLWGYYNLQELKKAGDMLEAGNKQVLAIYEERTGTNKVQLKHMIEKTTWMTGEEIIENGFADEIITGKDVTMTMNQSGTILMCNGIPMDTRRMAVMPRNVTVMQWEHKNENKEGEENMTLEEMKAKYPEMVKQIEDAARDTATPDVTQIANEEREKERNRIKEIESIENSIADKELIQNAKYGENPMDAKDLAFMAMQKQAQLGNEFLESRKEDLENSNTGSVQAGANEGNGQEGQRKEEMDIMAAVNAANQIRGGK